MSKRTQRNLIMTDETFDFLKAIGDGSASDGAGALCDLLSKPNNVMDAAKSSLSAHDVPTVCHFEIGEVLKKRSVKDLLLTHRVRGLSQFTAEWLQGLPPMVRLLKLTAIKKSPLRDPLLTIPPQVCILSELPHDRIE